MNTFSIMLLEQEEVNKVVLLNADVLSRKVSKRDRNSNPLIGDAATITVIEKSDSDTTVYGCIRIRFFPETTKYFFFCR